MPIRYGGTTYPNLRYGGVNYPQVRYGGVTYCRRRSNATRDAVRDGQLEGLRWRISYSNTVE